MGVSKAACLAASMGYLSVAKRVAWTAERSVGEWVALMVELMVEMSVVAMGVPLVA